MLSAAQPTCFLIADISGYAGYLADVELDDAQDIAYAAHIGRDALDASAGDCP